MSMYPYTKAVNIDRLTLEINQSSIITSLEHVDCTGTDTKITFKADLSDSDKTTLDGIIYSHSGLSLPSGPQPVTVQSIPSPAPFAAKNVGSKSLYKRVTGIQQSLNQGSNTILFTVSYNWAKINGIDVVGSEVLDLVSFYVLDSTTGTYTGTANLQLNQFGFNVNLPKDFYSFKSEFDADLYLNMQVKIVYNSVSTKNIGINFILNEVK